MKKKIIQGTLPFYGITLLIHLVGFGLLLMGSQAAPQFFGLGLLAYSLGLRHAFDADHISAIDNTVRRLLHQRQPAYGVGWYFSLGHSTVVFLMILVVRLSLGWAKGQLGFLSAVGGKIGSVVSGLFLLIIALSNFVVLAKLRQSRNDTVDSPESEVHLNHLLMSRGGLTRFIAPLFQWVRHDWQMYFIGFLFGLGFDTASEITVIALSATTQSNGTMVSIFALPILFAAGMNLMDTVDSTMMLGAYSWAFDTPGKKMRYNLIMTSISAIAATLIGGLELTQSGLDFINLKTVWGHWIQNVDISWLGYALVLGFMLIWGFTYLSWTLHQKRRQRA